MLRVPAEPATGEPIILTGNLLMLTIRAATNDDTPEVRELITTVLAEYKLALDPGGVDADLDDIESSYIRAGGVFDLVFSDENLVGTAALYRLDDKHGEIRKMYLAPDIRGVGLGKWLLDRLLLRAAGKGFEIVVLETASVLTEAIYLYRSFGFEPVPGDHEKSRCDQAFRIVLDNYATPPNLIRPVIVET